ncbi:MAG: putative phosphothreonine lyase domain-containing protein [Pseudomonadota bacterium]|nr:DUF1917 domain-containing protein [Gammaproteobacteria bacterium]MBU1926335.1 DUF1917 domain-containing protein [Gammaproteobacteria bacterium]
MLERNEQDSSSDTPAEEMLVTDDDNAIPSQFTGYWIYHSKDEAYRWGLPEYDASNIGKWMLFYHRSRIDAVWKKIKLGIDAGDLWHAKVSGINPSKKTHAIMVYTPDFHDLSDVVRVHDALVTNELKNGCLRYKTDNQTRAGIYSGGKECPWIYSSDMIEELRLKSKEDQSTKTRTFKH